MNISKILRKNAYRYYTFLILCIFVLLTFIFNVIHTQPSINETDGIIYMYRSLDFPPAIHEYHGPAYSLIISLVDTFINDTFLSAKMSTTIFSLVLLISLFFLFNSVTTIKNSLLAVLISLLSPLFLSSSNLIMSDIMATSLFVASVALILNSQKKLSFFFSGLIIGAAYLTRYVYLYLFILIIILAYFYIRGSTQNKLYKILLYFLGFIVISSPWMIYLYVEKGSPIWNKNYLNIAFSVIRGGSDWVDFPYSDPYGGLVGVLIQHWRELISKGIQNLALLPTHLGSMHEIAGIFAGVGFFQWCYALDRRKTLLLVLSIVYAGIVSILWLNPRFLLPLLPILSLSIAKGFSAVPKNLNLKPLRAPAWLPSSIPLQFPVIVLCLALLGAKSINAALNDYSVQMEDYRVASEQLSLLPPENARVLAAKPHIPFFADKEYLSFRGENRLIGVDIGNLCNVLNSLNPDYIIYDTRNAQPSFPELDALLNPKMAPTCLEHSFTVEESGQKLTAYRYEKS